MVVLQRKGTNREGEKMAAIIILILILIEVFSYKTPVWIAVGMYAWMLALGVVTSLFLDWLGVR